MGKIKIWLKAVRAPFFTGTVVPIILGSVVAWYHTGLFHGQYFFLTLLGGIFLHAATNVCNDYFDHISRCDDINTEFVSPYSGGSRTIQKGLLTAKEMLAGGLTFLALGSLMGLYLAWKRGLVILLIGLLGVFSAYFYTAPPFRLANHGIGELFVGLNFGTLMVLGAYYVQAQSLSMEATVVSIPVSILIALVLWINEFPDTVADKAVGKNTMVVRLGKRRAVDYYTILLTTTYISILGGVICNITPLWVLISFFTIPISVKAIKVAYLCHDKPTELAPANAMTIILHLLIGLLLSGGYILSKLSLYPY